MVLTTADLRALRDFLVASKSAFPVGQVTVIIPTARLEMARTTKKRTQTIRRPTGTLQRKKKPGPKPKLAQPEKVLAKCYFCPKEVDKNEFECSGCGEVVCDDCDELQPWGRHEPFEHTADGTEDD
jgi:hypothetical protein